MHYSIGLNPRNAADFRLVREQADFLLECFHRVKLGATVVVQVGNLAFEFSKLGRLLGIVRTRFSQPLVFGETNGQQLWKNNNTNTAFPSQIIKTL